MRWACLVTRVLFILKRTVASKRHFKWKWIWVILSDTIYLISGYVFAPVHVWSQCVINLPERPPSTVNQPDYYCIKSGGQLLREHVSMTQRCLVEESLTMFQPCLVLLKGRIFCSGTGARGVQWGHGEWLSFVTKEVTENCQMIQSADVDTCWPDSVVQ